MKTGRFGLPLEVKFCKKCTTSNQRPQTSVEFKNKKSSKKNFIEFDEEGVCAACRYAESKKNIDWNEREKELIELLNRFRRDDGRFDVVVPGSGGKDSVMTAHILKYKYNMNPLLVTWPPILYTEIGRRNFNSWLNMGFAN
jgi:predicted PP-loop superfamily ATPase